MPDLPENKRRWIEAAKLQVSEIPYAELHCKTNFSFLEGASHPDELICRAAELGYRAIAVTDRNSLAGVVRAYMAAKEVGLKLLIGTEIKPIDCSSVLLYPTDRAAYGRLCRLLTTGLRSAPKGECRLTFDDVAEYADGLIACVVGNTDTKQLELYRELFGDRCYLIAELHHGPNDETELDARIKLATQSRLPLVAANDVHFHDPLRKPLADVLTATKFGCTVAEAGELLFPNATRHLKSPTEMLELFQRTPDAVYRSAEIADRCNFDLNELRYNYPEELAPVGETPIEYLRRLTWAGVRKHFPQSIPEKIQSAIEHELSVISELHYEAYFLTIRDLIEYARSRNILCQIRGSAANSAVCYYLELSSVDPVRQDMLFERFISRERNEPPDIDIDFEHERREEVIQYVYNKYGRDRAGMTAEVISYRPRSAVRDVGKALGISLAQINTVTKTIDRHTTLPEKRCTDAGINLNSQTGKQLNGLVGELLGFPRHLGQHVGGMVITRDPLCEMVPIENARMPDRTCIQWDKDDLDELGILKVDCLSLGMLTAIHKCFDLVEKQHGRKLTLANIPEGDTPTYDMICKADTIGVFQIESRAQMSMLPRLKPRKFYDLVVEVAIVRPGPIQGDMVHPYLRRRMTGEEIEYPNEEIKEVLHKTMGVPLFQEQAMRLAMVVANFSPDEADKLRRAMAAWRKPGVIDAFRTRLMEGMRAKGLPDVFSEMVYRQINGFGSYGFPESHACSFALLVYVSAYIKCHYPAEFCAALLNSQPMGFYQPSQLVSDAQEHGVKVLPVDVNHSRWDCTIENHSVRLGFRMIKGFQVSQATIIEKGQPFQSINILHRHGVSKKSMEQLARADAFQSIKLGRRESLWNSLLPKDDSPLFGGLSQPEEPVILPKMDRRDEVIADYQSVGLSLKAHPMSFFREWCKENKIVSARELKQLKDGCTVRVAGIVTVRQRPGTAHGTTFVTLEDETGVVNLIVWKTIWEKYYQIAQALPAFIAHGELQNQYDVIHIVVSKFERPPQEMIQMRSMSRDFH